MSQVGLNWPDEGRINNSKWHIVSNSQNDFEYARVWTRVFPIDKRRHAYRHKSSEISIEKPSVGAHFAHPTTFSLHSFINLVNFIGILNLRGGIPNKMEGRRGGGRRRDSVLK